MLPQEGLEPLEVILIEAAVVGEAAARSLDELVEGPRASDADDWNREASAPNECLEGRNDFLVGEVARDAEDHKSVGRFAHDPSYARRCNLFFRWSVRFSLTFVGAILLRLSVRSCGRRSVRSC
jgi:hypothetical protein